jgi:hypothetical protein
MRVFYFRTKSLLHAVRLRNKLLELQLDGHQVSIYPNNIRDIKTRTVKVIQYRTRMYVDFSTRCMRPDLMIPLNQVVPTLSRNLVDDNF